MAIVFIGLGLDGFFDFIYFGANMPQRDELHPEVGKYLDPVIEAYKKDVDRTLLREALKMTPDERVRALESLMQNASEMQRAMKAAILHR
jgi:hypothetical protein